MSTRVGAARRHLSGLAAFAGVMAVTVAISVVARGVVRDQESRLLKERAGEVGVLLTSSLTGIGSSLSVLAGTATGTGPIQSTAFTHGATPLLTGNVKAVWIAGDHDGRFISTSAVGDGPNVGAPLAAGR